ncbi:MAG: molybdate ABC transporter substrate-binding protein [Pseudomonadota bacterium]
MRGLFMCLLGLLAALPRAGQSADLSVFAAASLKTVLEEVAADWFAETGHTALVVPAGSAALARQIQSGAPADIFVSANLDWMDVLEADGLLQPGSRRDLAGNRLVVAAHGDVEPWSALGDRLADTRIATALVDAVPAGIYARAALQHYGLWASLERQVVQTDNVRAALALVALGEAPLGIVYATDAEAEPRVSIAYAFPDTAHPRIVYPAAVLADSEAPQAVAFLEYLGAARATFARHGFTAP